MRRDNMSSNHVNRNQSTDRLAGRLGLPQQIGLVVLIIVLLYAVSPLDSFGETMRLTLEEAIALGLENSSTLKARMLAVSSSRSLVSAAKSSLYPSISTALTWTHLFDQAKSPESTFDVGTGTMTIPSNFLAATDPILFSADLSQSIFTFGKTKSEIKLAQENLTLAQLELEEEKRNLIVEITRGFFGYILAKEVVAVQEETLKQKAEALRVARERYDAGLIPDFEVLSAEADLEGFKPGVISAHNEVKLALLAVIDLLDIEVEDDFDIELIGKLEPEYHEFEREKLIQQALSKSFSLNQFRSNINLADHRRSLNVSNRRPDIKGFAIYTLQSGFDTATGENRYRGEDAWEGDLSIGLTFQMPISALFPWSRESAEKEGATLDLEELKVEQSSIESSIRLNIESILLKLEEEKAKIQSNVKSVELAQNLYKSAQEQYANGLISSIELEDAQIDLNAARLGYLTSVFNYKLALLDLADTVGVGHF
jgi:outer membrane protein TolC